jgi:CBS domain
MSSTVKDVMSTHVVAVRPDAGYKEMAATLREQRVSAFPVVDDDYKVIGVVSESDLLVKEALEGSVPGTLPRLTQRHVRSIWHEITKDLILGKFLCDPARFDVIASYGIRRNLLSARDLGPRPGRPNDPQRRDVRP